MTILLRYKAKGAHFERRGNKIRRNVIREEDYLSLGHNLPNLPGCKQSIPSRGIHFQYDYIRCESLALLDGFVFISGKADDLIPRIIFEGCCNKVVPRFEIVYYKGPNQYFSVN